MILFVNEVYMGNVDDKSIFGVHDAAEKYYGKPISDLSESEFVSLVAMMKGPNDYHVLSNSPNNKDRSEKIERLLRGECEPKDLFDDEFVDC